MFDQEIYKLENQSKILLELFIAQNVETENVPTFKPLRTMKVVSTSTKSAKPVRMYLMFPSKNKTDNGFNRWGW